MLLSSTPTTISYSLLNPTIKRCAFPVSIALLPGVGYNNRAAAEALLRGEGEGRVTVADPALGPASAADAQRQQEQPFPPHVSPALFHLLSHHCYGTLRHAAVRTLGDVVVPLLLSHCGGTLSALDLRNCERGTFTEAVGGAALIHLGDPSVLRVIDLGVSDYDVYATASDWEVSSSASSSVVHQPIAPTTPLAQFKYFLDQQTASAGAGGGGRSGGGVALHSQQQQQHTADSNILRPTARHYLNVTPQGGGGGSGAGPSSMSPPPSSHHSRIVYSAAFLSEVMRIYKFSFIIYGTPQMWRAEVSAKAWRLVAFERQLAEEGEAQRAAAAGEKGGNLSEPPAPPPKLSTEFMRLFVDGVALTVADEEEEGHSARMTSDHVGAAANPSSSSSHAAMVRRMRNGYVSIGRLYSLWDCLLLFLLLSPVSAAQQALCGADKVLWRCLAQYCCSGGGEVGGEASGGTCNGTAVGKGKRNQFNERLLELRCGHDLQAMLGMERGTAGGEGGGVCASSVSKGPSPTPPPPLLLSIADLGVYFTYYMYSMTSMWLRRQMNGNGINGSSDCGRTQSCSSFVKEWADSLSSVAKLNAMSVSGHAGAPTDANPIGSRGVNNTAAPSLTSLLTPTGSWFATSPSSTAANTAASAVVVSPHLMVPPTLALTSFTPLSILAPIPRGPSGGGIGIGGGEGGFGGGGGRRCVVPAVDDFDAFARECLTLMVRSAEQ